MSHVDTGDYDVICPLVRASDPLLYGGKAANLARLLRSEHSRGFRVPQGIAIDWQIVDLADANTTRMRSLVGIISREVPGPLVVRSSAVGEDGVTASFAGQHLTKLNVSVDGLADAIREVAASAQTPSALAYRKKHNIAGWPRMGIVVQTLIRSRVSGVMFTNMIAGRTVIEAARGFGDAVVQGIVTPDNYVMDADRICIQKRLGDQRVMVREAPDSAPGMVEVEVPALAEAVIDSRWRDLLCDVGDVCQKIFETPRLDIEWTIEAGALYVLQVRPITS